MDSKRQPVTVLSRALDQAGDALAAIHADDLDKPTPCADWTVRDLAVHLAASPGRFLAMSRGEEIDWSATAQIPDGTWAATFRAAADDLRHHWHAQPDDRLTMVGLPIAELAVHTWDLDRALGRSAELDDEVAAHALAFLQQGLTPDNRGDAFGAPVDVPGDASIHDRLAAFVGRDPSA